MQTVSFSETTDVCESELSNISNALWYILHLPRMGLDVTEMDIELVLSSHDTPHNIIPIPYSKKDENSKDVLMKIL